MRIWIDLSNSPHAPLFAPISRRLQDAGHEVLVTARDNAQTVELARQSWETVAVVGGRSLNGRLAKGRGMLQRIGDLADWARQTRPDVALSHNSYGQIVAARRLGIRAVTAMDYEHQPANHLAFRLADSILLPAALRDAQLRRQGATPRKVRFYEGLKEEIYLGDFEPSPQILADIGIEHREGDVLVVARTPPAGALYHRSDNPLFGQILEKVCGRPGVHCVTLCRHPEQRQTLAKLELENLTLPERAVDARSLIHAADLVVGAGGTMTREAALLGVPTVSVFAGRTPAADRWLEQRGALQRLHDIADLPPLQPRPKPPRDPSELWARGELLADEFVDAVAGTPARKLARRLDAWGSERGWQGSDPYEGLNARRGAVAPLKRFPLGRRLLIQTVKRSPLDLRRPLGIPQSASAASVAWAISAYARNGFLGEEEARRRLDDCLALLRSLRLPGFGGSCWGYHFDVQSRVFFYPSTTPNTIATAFAGLALLDAYAALGDPALLAEATEAGQFFLRHVPQTDDAPGAFFGYLPGDRSPIHNSNLLVASLLARIAQEGAGNEGFAEAAEAAVTYTTARQHPDGSWPYGERPGLEWVDNFHTGYVLDALRTCADAGVAAEQAETAWRRGITYYRRRLFLPDGTPRYYADKTLPIDAQCVAQGIQTLAIAAPHEPATAPQAWAVLDFALRRMVRRDGLPIFQRRRFWANRAVHVRWVAAPMLLALSHLLQTSGDESSPAGVSLAARALA